MKDFFVVYEGVRHKKCRDEPGTFATSVPYMVLVKVRVMTSICCSLVSELKRTA